MPPSTRTTSGRAPPRCGSVRSSMSRPNAGMRAFDPFEVGHRAPRARTASARAPADRAARRSAWAPAGCAENRRKSSPVRSTRSRPSSVPLGASSAPRACLARPQVAHRHGQVRVQVGGRLRPADVKQRRARAQGREVQHLVGQQVQLRADRLDTAVGDVVRDPERRRPALQRCGPGHPQGLQRRVRSLPAVARRDQADRTVAQVRSGRSRSASRWSSAFLSSPVMPPW